ncbi:MAG: hypothetical protein LBM13_05800 [Candidatus Ancillula sp.]|jgi:phenylpyruvate tautomerase PptA (4-oxalocrotonate tautomerase family)|nr:hypothetical protein [Candidatus Ancillula sp.]
MPTINIHTNKKISEDTKELVKQELGKAIETIPGKSESWLMVLFDDQKDIYFKGDNQQDIAFVEVGISGHASRDNFRELGSQITHSLTQNVKIPAGNVYISYSEFDTFSWNGSLL